MPSCDAFALPRSRLNGFLFAAIGTEANGMTLSVLSVLARWGHDPWEEAGRLAGLPKAEAAECLAGAIAGLPTSLWPLPAATEIATKLIALLHRQAAQPAQVGPSSTRGATAKRAARIGIILLCLACAMACETGGFGMMGAATMHGVGAGPVALQP